MQNQKLISEEQLDEIKEIRELMKEDSLVIRTNGALFDGKEIVIETMSSRGGNYEPTIVIDAKDFYQYNPLVIPNGYCFESPTDKNYIYAYIDEVGKFTVLKEPGLLDNIFHGFKEVFGS